MLGNIQTLLSGRNWLCLILKPHNKGYISFVSILNLSINSGYFTFFLPFFSVPLPSLCPCLPHPLPSGSLPPSLPASPPYLSPSLSLFFTPSLHITLLDTASLPWLLLSLPVSFLQSLPASHSLPHCFPSFMPSIPPSLPPLLLYLAPSLPPELSSLSTFLTF